MAQFGDHAAHRDSGPLPRSSSTGMVGAPKSGGARIDPALTEGGFTLPKVHRDAGTMATQWRRSRNDHQLLFSPTLPNATAVKGGKLDVAIPAT